MRLELITIYGFKSFAEKTDLRVLPGITCIVGPNGCGKSNVGDAIRWALGEQSPKILRGHRMEDVIFHGSASRKPIGLAEVSLVFDNDGTLAVPWSEVGVARRLYRTGESEYLLNKSVCRLRDIQDLFAGTGVNPKAYALMDQERLNHVLTAKPWERRAFIEEAAGVARYKQQRTEAQGKLDATRQNLQRVRDVMDEVRRQLGSLERQARKAQQYKVLHQEKQALALAMLAADFAALSARQETVAREMEALQAQREQTNVLIAQLAAREASQRAAIQETDFRLADLRQAAQKIQGEAERLIERREQLTVQLRELGEEDVRLAEEVRGISDRRLGLAVERDDKTAALAEAEERHGEVTRRIGELETELEEIRAGLAERRQRGEGLRVTQVRVAAARAELTREEAELRERLVHVGRRGERLETELTGVRVEADGLAAARRTLEDQRQRTDLELSALDAERRGLRVTIEERESLRAGMQTSLSEARLALAARRSQHEALERLEREREGYGAGVRAVFSAGGGSHLSGVMGTVADLLEVPAGLEAAVESVLGDRLQWVVVERFEHARTALGFLDREGAGSATFLPLETLPSAGAQKWPPHSPNGGPADAESHGAPDDAFSEIRWALRLVGCPWPALLHYLLGRVGVVDHLDQAEALWRRNGVVATYVTPAGEVLSPTGRLTGGRRAGERQDQELSILRRKRTIRQLAEELEATAREVDILGGRLEALDVDVTSLRAREAGLQSALQAQEAVRLAGEKDLESAVREEERVRRHLETLGVEERQLDAEGAEASTRLDEVRGALTALLEREAALEAEVADLGRSLESAQQSASAFMETLTAHRVELAGVTERTDSLRRDILRIEELGREAGARFEQASLRRAQVAERRTELGLERDRADRAGREAAAERDRVEAEVREADARHQREAAALQVIETETRQAEHERTRLTGELHQRDLTATEDRVRSEDLIQQARRAHDVEGAPALLAQHDPDRDLAAATARHDELQAKIEGLGAVNLVADEEYRELEERLSFLRTQHDDLVASIKDLERALRGMTRTAQERFQQAFEEINRHFQDIFSRLFEGGRAELRMVEAEEGDEDPLELGVELMAQPRGKRLQAVSLMSGGEKALTGLALLFAIFYFRPSPFCVLDEVDAPLDDANIHRFLRVLRELTSHTQFVVITHNRKTMEAADVLYGVTMEEPGLSRLVSVKLTEA
jgi:chromosome segregation protein